MFKNLLQSWHEWLVLLLGVPVAFVALLVGVRKLSHMVGVLYKSAVFMLDIEAIFARLQVQMSDGFTQLEEGQLHIIHTRRHVMDADDRNAFFESDARGMAVWANRFWRKITGLELDTLRGNGWENGIAPEARQRVVYAWNQAIDHQRNFDEDVIYIDRHGRRTSMKVTASPIRNKQGAVLGYFGSAARLDPESATKHTL